ncbi:ArsR/SmtB family transcription factor [Microbacterium amylolyticum]|uniref:DNA-binding transcriptional ArsR family regulator n=1 Tax=Microbacterium amylolyticum TaxID=936337 RepID=A0ABS4ZJY6_9MICO|nr:metalloregulator ArsR/SmtB family transcription factor [Microbacterium amylolyticum]MBP2437318.1 DNA-binding transcriptional ArsR family regulator [Microbacterium amylolyticum]
MADIFDVIADGTRRDILQLLLRRDQETEAGTSVSEIVGELSVSQPTVSKHLKVLREAGLVSVREEGQHRFYRLEPEPLDEVDDWLVPFFVDESDLAAEAAHSIYAPLPEQASKLAESLGRTAAVVQTALKRLGA